MERRCAGSGQWSEGLWIMQIQVIRRESRDLFTRAVRVTGWRAALICGSVRARTATPDRGVKRHGLTVLAGSRCAAA